MASNRNTLSLTAIEGQLLPEEETYQASLRAAVFNGISETDVADVVKQIVAKAKGGDSHAQKLFFDYLLGAKTKPTQINIHNHYPDVVSAGRKVEADARAARAKRRLSPVQDDDEDADATRASA